MKISVITATYNSAATVEDTLHSVNQQSYPDVEQLIIDGSSTDGTLDLVHRVGKRVSHCISAKDEGIYDAMNKGIAIASGDLIGILNSDDFYATPDVLAAVAAAFQKNPSLEAIYGDLCYVRQDNIHQVVRYWKSSAYKPGQFQTGWVPPHPTFFARKDVYDRFGGFNLKYRLAADWELLVRMIEVHRIKVEYLPKVLVHMRLGGATNKSFTNVWRQNREIWSAAQAHSLHPRVAPFVLGKLWSRGQQFLARAT